MLMIGHQQLFSTTRADAIGPPATWRLSVPYRGCIRLICQPAAAHHDLSGYCYVLRYTLCVLLYILRASICHVCHVYRAVLHPVVTPPGL